MAWHRAETNSGGFGPGVPPLPIPNREVKPGRADGTAPQCGRVGRRLLDGAPPHHFVEGSFFCSGFLCTFIIRISLQALPAFLYRCSPYSFTEKVCPGVSVVLYRDAEK